MAQDDIVNKLFEMAGDLPIKAPDHKYVAWMSKRLDAALARAEAAERRVAELEVVLQKWRKFVGFDHPAWDNAFTPDNDWSQLLIAKSIETNPRETIITYGDGTRQIISYSKDREE